MIRLRGPIRDLLEETPSEERVARVEQAVSARRLGRSAVDRRWVLAFAAALAVIATLAIKLSARETAPQIAGGNSNTAPPIAAEQSPAREAAPLVPENNFFGATVEATPPSAVEVARSDDTLIFALSVGGRVLLDIPPDTGRRWIVEAGLARAEVVGTKFAVARFADRVEVDVMRGRVRVTGEVLPEAHFVGEGEHFEVRAVKDAPVAPIAPAPIAPAAPRRAAQPAAKDPAPQETAPAVEVDAVADLLARADAARAAGDHAGAVSLLQSIAREHAGDARAGLASFVAARIQQDVLAQPLEAAAAIEEALRLGLAAELRESALARRFEAYLSARDDAGARRAAHEYLAAHPSGRHADAARRIAGVAAP